MPGVKKKVYKVYVTYKGSDLASTEVYYAVNGESTKSSMYQFNSDNTPLANHSDVSKCGVAELKPTTSSEANNIYSIACYFNDDTNTSADFEINDITIVYRIKNIK